MRILIKRTWGLLEGHERRQLGLLVLLMIGQACLEVVSIGSILPFMGLLERPEAIHSMWFTQWAYETLGFTSDRAFLVMAGVIVLALFLLVNVVNALSLWAQARFAWMRSFSISRRLLAAFLGRPYTFFLRRNTSDFNRSIYQEVRQVVVGLILPSVRLLSRSISIILILALLIYINWWLSLGLAVLFAGTYAIVFLVSRKALSQIGTSIVRANEECYRVTNEAFGGIKEAKLGGLESAYVDAFSPPGHVVARMSTRRVVIAGVPRYILESVAFGGMLALVLILLGTTGSIAKIIPTASVFAFAGYRLMPALSQIFISVANIRSSTASLDVVVKDLDDAADEPDFNLDAAPLPLVKSLALKDLSFSYDGNSQAILENINLEIACGESIALVGPTGAGKTTLIDILLGLLEPGSGQMLVDDVSIDRTTVRGWQRQLGYVPQHIFLGDDTIARNISLGTAAEDINRERLEQTATIAGLHEFITTDLPEGYETRVGERGVRLSGGQIQRLGLARALYGEPSVLFLDEATSALDAHTEQQVMQGIQGEARDRTVIVIAHRLSTVRFCDRIVVLDRGRIVDMGSWDDLMDRCEVFQKLAGEHESSVASSGSD
ncbi:MAG: ATP-binding cassette domain-containing protein [Phycisphaerales bacterium]|nr:ATP-binding cassette domain-containing protein [Phycisphaerales bacterium]